MFWAATKQTGSICHGQQLTRGRSACEKRTGRQTALSRIHRMQTLRPRPNTHLREGSSARSFKHCWQHLGPSDVLGAGFKVSGRGRSGLGSLKPAGGGPHAEDITEVKKLESLESVKKLAKDGSEVGNLVRQQRKGGSFYAGTSLRLTFVLSTIHFRIHRARSTAFLIHER